MTRRIEYQNMNPCRYNNRNGDNPMKDIEEFKKDLQSQKKKVYEKINPILHLYDKGEITKIEFIDKLADAFYSLEAEY